MNFETARDALLLAGGFAILPSELTGKLAFVVLLLGGLYLLRGKVPKQE